MNELSPTVGPTVTVVEETPGFAVGVLDQVVLLRTLKPMEPESLDALFRITTSQMQTFGPRLLYVVIPGAAEPSVNLEAQRRLAAVWPRVQAQSSAGVMWIRNAGFTGALNRKQLTELLSHLRDRSILGVTHSAAETVEFFRSHAPDQEFDGDAWIAAFEEFAARFD